jgi:hypothetical protein
MPGFLPQSMASWNPTPNRSLTGDPLTALAADEMSMPSLPSGSVLRRSARAEVASKHDEIRRDTAMARLMG